jgi:hypothetical protein
MQIPCEVMASSSELTQLISKGISFSSTYSNMKVSLLNLNMIDDEVYQPLCLPLKALFVSVVNNHTSDLRAVSGIE